jgi:hypothetical protein
MKIPSFDPKELELQTFEPFPGYKISNFSYPLSQREHEKLVFRRTPWWQATQATDATMFTPAVIPDNVARALIMEGGMPRQFADHEINPDMFGVEWEYIATVGGSMVRPGKAFLEDIEEWYDKVQFPDIDKWDWDGSAAKNNGTYLNETTFAQMWFQTGFFERLIALLEFENAAVAIIDEDSQEHVHKFFDKLTDLYIRIFDKIIDTYKAPDGSSYIKAVFFHDDWGSQKSPFFSPDVCDEMVVPYMKRLTDFLHGKGIFCELHSCGNNYLQIPNMIKAGWDAWAPQLMNDSYKIYDDFGDKLLIATFPQNVPSAEELGKLPEEDIRKAARDYADKCCIAGKSSFYNYYAASYLQIPAFKEELYKQSRINYSK